MRSLIPLLSLVSLAFAAEPVEIPIADKIASPPPAAPSFAVSVSATFPSAEIFGLKLVNNKPTSASITITNSEPDAISLNFIGGALWSPKFDPKGPHIIRNLTATRYHVSIAPGEKESVEYSFATNLHPQELRLELAAMLRTKGGVDFVTQAYNGSVSAVEPDTSIFDPQVIFLYFFLAACASGVIYTFYNIWVAPYFPQKRKGGGIGGLKKSAAGDRKVDDGLRDSAVTTGSKTYDEAWIPAHHMQRPEAKRAKSGTPKSKGKP